MTDIARFVLGIMGMIPDVGYKLFPWGNDAPDTHPQNVVHIIVTAAVVVFSLSALFF